MNVLRAVFACCGSLSAKLNNGKTTLKDHLLGDDLPLTLTSLMTTLSPRSLMTIFSLPSRITVLLPWWWTCGLWWCWWWCPNPSLITIFSLKPGPPAPLMTTCVSWLIGWLVNWLTDWSIDWFVEYCYSTSGQRCTYQEETMTSHQVTDINLKISSSHRFKLKCLMKSQI